MQGFVEDGGPFAVYYAFVYIIIIVGSNIIKDVRNFGLVVVELLLLLLLFGSVGFGLGAYTSFLGFFQHW